MLLLLLLLQGFCRQNVPLSFPHKRYIKSVPGCSRDTTSLLLYFLEASAGRGLYRRKTYTVP